MKTKKETDGQRISQNFVTLLDKPTKSRAGHNIYLPHLSWAVCLKADLRRSLQLSVARKPWMGGILGH